MFRKLLKLIKPAPKISFIDRVANFEKILLNNNLNPQKKILGNWDEYPYNSSVSYLYPGNYDAQVTIYKNRYELLCELDCGVIYYNNFSFEDEDTMLQIIKSSRYIS